MVPAGDKISYLRTSCLFERTSDETIAQCEHIFFRDTFRKGTVVFEPGDGNRRFYMIDRGRVRVSRTTAGGKELTVALLGPGDLFGEEAVFAEVPHTTRITCLEETSVYASPAEDLHDAMTRYPTLAINVAKYMSKRRREALSIVEDFASLKVPERLIKLIERLAEEYGTPCQEGRLLNISLTHNDIASLIGSTRETVTLQLNQLKRDGVIAMRGRAIILM